MTLSSNLGGTPVQFRLFAAIAVFLGSYLPLSLILLAQDFDYTALERTFCVNFDALTSCQIPLRNPAYAIGIFLVCLASFLLTMLALARIKPHTPIVIDSAKHTPADLINYTLPYVVSFMSIDYNETGKFVGLAIFLGWMFWITHRSGQLILNPLLIAFGWRPYEITYHFVGDTKQRNDIAFSQSRLEANTTRYHAQIQAVLIIKDRGTES